MPLAVHGLLPEAYTAYVIGCGDRIPVGAAWPAPPHGDIEGADVAVAAVVPIDDLGEMPELVPFGEEDGFGDVDVHPVPAADAPPGAPGAIGRAPTEMRKTGQQQIRASQGCI